MKGKQNAASLNQPKKPQKKSGFQRDSESKQEEELEAALLQKYNKLAKKNYKKALKIVQSRHQDDFEDFPYDLVSNFLKLEEGKGLYLGKSGGIV